MYPTNPHTAPDTETETETETGRALWALRNSAPYDDAPDPTCSTIDFLLSVDIPLMS